MSPEVESTKWWVVNECNITLGWITPLSLQQLFSALVRTKKDSDWLFNDETTFGDWQDEALKPQQSTYMAKLTRIHCEDGTGSGSVSKDNITAIAVSSSFKQKRCQEFRHGMSLCWSDQPNPEMVFTSLTATNHKGAILMFRLYGPNSHTMGGVDQAKVRRVVLPLLVKWTH